MKQIEMVSSYGVPRDIRSGQGCMYAINETPITDKDGDPVELYAEVITDKYGDNYEKYQTEIEDELETLILEQAAALGIPASCINFDWYNW